MQKLSNADSSQPDREIQDLLNLSKHLIERLDKTKRQSEWPFNLSSLLKLTATSFLPVITYLVQQRILTLLNDF